MILLQIKLVGGLLQKKPIKYYITFLIRHHFFSNNILSLLLQVIMIYWDFFSQNIKLYTFSSYFTEENTRKQLIFSNFQFRKYLVMNYLSTSCRRKKYIHHSEKHFSYLIFLKGTWNARNSIIFLSLHVIVKYRFFHSCCLGKFQKIQAIGHHLLYDNFLHCAICMKIYILKLKNF